MKINDVILQTVTKIVVFIILTMAIYLFISGHNSPGGGFIGGLILASAFVLLCLAFDIETITNGIPLDFKKVAATGGFIVLGTGLGASLFDVPFLSQAHSYVNFPIVGKTALATVTLFEAGVALAVVGVVVTIILSISEDV
ncbi:Na(+)/H(+) antiporter subunit B [Lederbergia wuyishanensis]|uniref:Multicomponent Na+:H+ antiporter subunit B n=1 Tax=Lederbergia wuyishanensis TaxID=1347903 RepID=A0ABU0D261_9BACI|nr:Na(+)/H(+) antiporter subunit B [Lederbergia wuyishanensis]MCJ8007359.1 Na(+)/H(+) antiporter subunit B [Lederbergia wuyishanensis]MDQ0342474.1 multicomponent Na+:H+ antiporter subunit B [Lederbergia wuyishanensis]